MIGHGEWEMIRTGMFVEFSSNHKSGLVKIPVEGRKGWLGEMRLGLCLSQVDRAGCVPCLGVRERNQVELDFAFAPTEMSIIHAESSKRGKTHGRAQSRFGREMEYYINSLYEVI